LEKDSFAYCQPGNEKMQKKNAKEKKEKRKRKKKRKEKREKRKENADQTLLFFKKKERERVQSNILKYLKAGEPPPLQ